MYQIVDCALASTLPLPELAPSAQQHAHWRFVLEEGEPPGAAPVHHYWTTAAGRRWASFARCGERLLIRFSRTGIFVVDEERRTIHGYPFRRSGPNAIRPLLLNQVMPLVLGNDRLVLHASAVVTPAGAIGFVGRPGAGKSTLAAACARRGLPLVTDDFLVIETIGGVPHAVPSRVEPRLWPDAVDALVPGDQRRFPRVRRHTKKRRLSPARACGITMAERAVPLGRLFLLADSGDSFGLEAMTRANALVSLTACTFFAGLDRPAETRRMFERIASVVQTVPMTQLIPVRDFARLEAICDAVLAKCEEGRAA